MSDRPTSFHDFKWACGHTGPGYCKICRDEQVERLEAELEKTCDIVEVHDDALRTLNSENARLREALESANRWLHEDTPIAVIEEIEEALK